MQKYIIILLLSISTVHVLAQRSDSRVNPAIDNQTYWKKMAELGLSKLNPVVPVEKADFKGSQLFSPLLAITNSPDVVIVNTAGITQSENSVAINPSNIAKALNSNNSQSGSFLGTSGFMTNTQGASWTGSINGTGGGNSGDPAADISNTNRYYVGFISSTLGQGVATSTNEGATWQAFTVATAAPGQILDKNHLWVDKSVTSPFVNNVYAAWTDFNGVNNQRIVFARSTNGGVNWSGGINISGAVGGTSLHQGVNINSGPNGEVYVSWIVYNNTSSLTENSVNFVRSLDGGVTFSAPQIIANNIRGIRATGVGKNMRVNSFPCITADNSFGPNRGTLYAVWANIGVPGINTGNDVDIYMVRSVNGGTTWSTPQKVNVSTVGAGKKNYFPWITCDRATGKLHIVYYSDRNVTSTQCETFISSSFDGGTTWTDVRISDVAFTPSPIPGLASGYFGDYLGISANDDVIYPVWTDNRTGAALAYTSPLVSADFCNPSLTLQNLSMPLPATYKYRAETTIATAGAGTSFTMQGNGSTGARASMVAANSITLSPNTDIQKGAILTVLPGPCTSPVLRPAGVSETETVVTTDIRRNQEPEAGSMVNVYPNPAEDLVYVKLVMDVKTLTGVQYTITDLLGKVILRGNITKINQDIDIKSLAKGNGYFLNVYQAGKLLETKKLIKN
jgi:Secretion system C-terminal sorting domain